MAGLQEFHQKSCTFNTLFWTKKTEARQTGKNTSLTYSEYVVRGLSVRPLRTGFFDRVRGPGKRIRFDALQAFQKVCTFAYS